MAVVSNLLLADFPVPTIYVDCAGGLCIGNNACSNIIAMLTRCLYCDRDKEDITGEHVIPRGIGGNLKETNPFKLKEVCSECNNGVDVMLTVHLFEARSLTKRR